MAGRRRMLGVVGLLAVAGLIGAACTKGGETAGAPAAGGRAQFREVTQALPGQAGGAAPSPATDGRGGDGSVSGLAGLPELGTKVIKTAHLGLTVRPGTFQDRFQQAAMVAASHGGFVASSSTSEGRFRSGSLVLRVPAADFEAALGELRELGRVRSQSISGEDVTGRVVDLQARLRNWQAQEAILLRLMTKAASIEDSIVVQRQLQDVQLQIEEIRGQLHALDDQTAFSTISLSMSEAGFIPPTPRAGGLSFGKAWRLAAHGFVAVFSAVLVGLGYLLPILLMGLALVASVVAYRRLRRVPTPS